MQRMGKKVDVKIPPHLEQCPPLTSVLLRPFHFLLRPQQRLSLKTDPASARPVIYINILYFETYKTCDCFRKAVLLRCWSLLLTIIRSRWGGGVWDRVLVDFLAGKVREVCAAALDSPPEVNNLLTELRTGLSPPASPPPPPPQPL